MSDDNERKAKDAMACLDDYAHAELCADWLLNGQIHDNTIVRALWQSALISIRRGLGNSQSMHIEKGGKFAKPFDRAEAKSYLTDQQKIVFDEFLYLADKSVAHRQPIEGVRTVKVIEDEVTGNPSLQGNQMLPTFEQRKSLKTISGKLKVKAMVFAALACGYQNNSSM